MRIYIFFALTSLCSAASVVMAPVVSEKACPLQHIQVPAKDGHQTPLVLRKPPGKGPFPALIFLHGGLNTGTMTMLDVQIRSANMQRFLAAGWVVAVPTFRPRNQDPQTRDALEDCKDVVEYVRHLPEVDPRSVVVWGTSGGGSLALEVAGESKPAAIIPDEPASILFAGTLTKDAVGSRRKGPGSAFNDLMANPQKYYTPEIQNFTREKIARIECPILLVEGGVHIINRINNEIIIPEMVKARRNLQVILYPGEAHGFSRGNGTPAAVGKFFDDASRFLAPHLATKPGAIDRSLVEFVEAKRDPKITEP